MKTLALSLVLLIHGWYPQSCCADTHCHPVPCDQLVEESNGWRYIPDNRVFPFAVVYPSKDRNCHICTNNSLPLCAFIQQGV